HTGDKFGSHQGILSGRLCGQTLTSIPHRVSPHNTNVVCGLWVWWRWRFSYYMRGGVEGVKGSALTCL
ncbi:MAG: hypothetical protein SF123_05675, partial [Chloroflexota bacterium]|nr:hypothetical protein [Chloroflexota bacterium]